MFGVSAEGTNWDNWITDNLLFSNHFPINFPLNALLGIAQP